MYSPYNNFLYVFDLDRFGNCVEKCGKDYARLVLVFRAFEMQGILVVFYDQLESSSVCA